MTVTGDDRHTGGGGAVVVGGPPRGDVGVPCCCRWYCCCAVDWAEEQLGRLTEAKGAEEEEDEVQAG